jgi:cyclic pyranopterin phosphate synthase
MQKRKPTYLRTVVTTKCNLHCSYCHMEGDPQTPHSAHMLPLPLLGACLQVAARAGIQKFKFLGGEPLLRQDLPDVVRGLRAHAPSADLSIITAAALPTGRLDEVMAAGLDRVNVSIHGFSQARLAERHHNASKAWQQRDAFVKHARAYGRPMKLNYVYSGPEDAEDLGALLDWAAPLDVTVGVLDNLGCELDWTYVADVVSALRGLPVLIERDEDPHSLETLVWRYADGLRVEFKTEQLGHQRAFGACASCPARARCKEGIFALRLSHTGDLRPCMDRPDLSLPLAQIVGARGVEAGLDAWERFVEAL